MCVAFYSSYKQWGIKSEETSLERDAGKKREEERWEIGLDWCVYVCATADRTLLSGMRLQWPVAYGISRLKSRGLGKLACAFRGPIISV